MDREHKLLGYYNYTVILTYIGMLSGFVGIVSAFEGGFFKAIICLMFSGLCDMFDGTVAATMERTPQEKCFGIQIDSFSDIICFGVLPAAIAYSMNSELKGALAVSAFYVLCALIRLSYFNVDEQERQKQSAGSREVYLGMPVTLAALFIPLIYAELDLHAAKSSIALSVALVIMGILFLVPIRLNKPKMLGKVCFVLCGIAEVILVAMPYIKR
ncbi:MAG: CDP-alcohol phosphatidyltransferase family protein [Clostridia bacterium]|nr:CDP-alcohol phosphatidyltransferase family protein [Clostridia bacterium]MDO5302629.1 CDP-alcohol phosphatidyltransferase family protein [Clostridia bacterium]